MSFIVDRIKQVGERKESQEVYLLEREAIKKALEKIEEANGWSEEGAKPKFHKQLDKYIDAIIIKSMYDSWDLSDNKIDLDCLRLTLAVYQKKLNELDAVLSKKLETE